MATRAKKHHFVPQWLLERFVSHEPATRGRVFVMRKDKTPVPSAPGSTGYGRYFYGQPEEGLEAMLATLDGEDGNTIVRLEGNEDPNAIAPTLCRLVRLLAIRTRSLRCKFAETGDALLTQMADRAWEDDAQNAFIDNIADQLDELLEPELRKLNFQTGTKVPSYVLRALAWQQFSRARSTMENFLPLLLSHVRDTLDFDAAAANGHVKGLLKLLRQGQSDSIPAGWLQLRWSVHRFSEPVLILGDAVSFALDEADLPVNTAFAGQAPKAVYLPINPQTLLVAARDALPDRLDPRSINEIAARQSFECVFASRITDEERRLAPLIGEMTGLLRADQIESINNDAWRRRTDEPSRTPSIPRLQPYSEPTAPCPDTLSRLGDFRIAHVDTLPDFRVSGRNPSEELLTMWSAPSALAAAYAHVMKLGHLSGRLRIVSHYPMSVVFRGPSGEHHQGIGAAVGIAGAAPIRTILLSAGSPETVTVCRDTRSWIDTFTRAPRRT